MNIRLAETDADIEHCLPVLIQLRPGLNPATFVADARRQIDAGYHLALLSVDGVARAVAGYRIIEMFSRGRFLYVDDLVTDIAARSQGYGDALFDWLLDQAREAGCTQVDLDSGVQRPPSVLLPPPDAHSGLPFHRARRRNVCLVPDPGDAPQDRPMHR
jgi:GNAT superfamily N-acetyltransferase